MEEEVEGRRETGTSTRTEVGTDAQNKGFTEWHSQKHTTMDWCPQTVAKSDKIVLM